jgi:hypothetical protein
MERSSSSQDKEAEEGENMCLQARGKKLREKDDLRHKQKSRNLLQTLSKKRQAMSLTFTTTGVGAFLILFPIV